MGGGGNTADVRALVECRRQRRPFGGFSEEERPANEEDAYRIQDRLLSELTAYLGPHIGYKIGCTTPVMQTYLEIDHPCAGGVLQRTLLRSPATIGYGNFQRLGVECEIAVRLAADAPPGGAPFERDDVEPLVESVMPALEVVEDRYEDFRQLDAPTLIADNFFAAACVVGPPTPPALARDLAHVSASLSVNGDVVGSAQGKNVLGHPLEALAWLANWAAERGHGLRSGDVVLLGSLIETRWIEPGDEVAVLNDALGEVRVTFTT